MPENGLPFCSVVVPTRDRPAQLAACRRALADLDYPTDRLETIVVDDCNGTGPGAARNRAAAEARGELLVFTDDDCLPAPGWLRALVDRWCGDPDLAVGGHTTNGVPSNPFTTASQTIVDLVYAHYNDGSNGARFFASNNLAVPAAAFRTVGGFDERFRWSEDRDFCARWRASGRRLAYAEDAVVAHAPALTLGRFCRQHFAYGRGAYRYHRARPVTTAESVRSELTFHRHLPGRLQSALASTGTRRTAALAGLLVLWQAANAAGFAWEAVRARD